MRMCRAGGWIIRSRRSAPTNKRGVGRLDDDATRRVYAFGFGSGGYLLMLMCVESRDGARMMRDSPMCDVRTKK